MGSKKYFARIDGEQRGPFTLDELIESGVRPKTYIWRKGMDDWERAENDAEICRAIRLRLSGVRNREIKTGEESAPLKPSDSNPEGFNFTIRRFPVDGNINPINEVGDPDRKPPYSLYIMLSFYSLIISPLIGIFAIYYAFQTRKLWLQSLKDGLSSEQRRNLRIKSHDNLRKNKMAIGFAICFTLMMIGLIFLN